MYLSKSSLAVSLNWLKATSMLFSTVLFLLFLAPIFLSVVLFRSCLSLLCFLILGCSSHVLLIIFIQNFKCMHKAGKTHYRAPGQFVPTPPPLHQNKQMCSGNNTLKRFSKPLSNWERASKEVLKYLLCPEQNISL